MPILILLVLVIVPLLVLPSPWDLIGAGIGLLLGIGAVLATNETVRHRRKQVGAGTLIGKNAVVITPCQPDGQVRVDGEIWAARAEAGAGIGDSVQVVGREQLTLLVEPVSGDDRSPGD